MSLATALCAAVCAATPAAAAGVELTEHEIAELYAGHLVAREDTVERGGRRYIGGVSYVLIDSAPERVIAVLGDVGAYRHILPRTRSVRWIGISRGEGDSVVELEQGTGLAHGKYTVHLRREHTSQGSSSATIRFWLDERYPHDIEDANGYFRVEPLGDRTLLTSLVMIDLGSGIVATLFENRVRRAALSTPMLVKAYVESPAQRPSRPAL